MHCVKLLGQPLMARDFDRQVAELQVRIAVLNGYTALGIPVTETVGQVCPGKGEARLSADLRNRVPGRATRRRQIERVSCTGRAAHGFGPAPEPPRQQLAGQR